VAYLRGAGLRGADSLWAWLSEANLTHANLAGADCRGGYVGQADLSHADPRGANLIGTDLQGADLCGAKVTHEQLAYAKSLKGATLPDGTKHAARPPAEPRLAEAAKPEPAPVEAEADDAKGQSDQVADLGAGGCNRA